MQLASDKDGSGSSESLVMCLGDHQQLHSLCDFGGARRCGGLCVSIRHKAEGRLTCGVTGETRPPDDSRGTTRWGGLCVASLRNKAAGWLRIVSLEK